METTDPREAVDAAMKGRDINQGDLAALIGSHPAAVSRVLNSGLIDRRSLWLKIFDALDLEVVIRPKSKQPKAQKGAA
jgi:antitoxin component HigA of HigAB toxin-antitoxin module